MLLRIMRYCRQEVYIRGVLIWELQCYYSIKSTQWKIPAMHSVILMPTIIFTQQSQFLDCLFNKVAFGTFYSY